jgi:UDP-N-acetylglucosamine 2-epimerase (non-hydrolysing)
VQNQPLQVMLVFGTRPEALKLAPVLSELKRRGDRFSTRVCVTGQHREMLDQVLDVFAIRPDFDLNLMEEGQSLAGFGARALTALDELFRSQRPDVVLVQGDTTTTFVASLAAFYHHIAVGHVEAGLRSFNKRAPFPEEINRRLTTHLADLHFAPTERARENLLAEGIRSDSIFVTGNTIVDAVLEIAAGLESGRLRAALADRFPMLPAPFILVTAHRRENQGERLRGICRAIRELSDRLPEYHFLFPVHLNPEVQAPVRESLGALDRVHLLPPLDYLSFVWAMQHSSLVLSDSGGVQEECPSLGKRVLVMREVTERPEAVESGWAQLVGSDPARITVAVLDAVRNGAGPASGASNPFGDGRTAEKVVAALERAAGEFEVVPQ